MTEPGPPGDANEAFWRDFLTHGDPRERRLRRLFRLMPADHRCKLCAAPFSGLGTAAMRLIGKRPSGRNPNVCNTCFDFMSANHGGAEIECSFLFADIRGSTGLAEGMTSTEFRAILDRFYAAASGVVFANEGVLDKFVGDELVAMFYPFIGGPDHAGHAIRSARALLAATGHGSAGGPWVPLGAGVHSGVAWVGAIGDATHTELTAVGDNVNVAARLAAAAAAGEILVSTAAATAGGLDPALPRRSLELKGKQLPTEVVTLRVDGG